MKRARALAFLALHLVAGASAAFAGPAAQPTPFRGSSQLKSVHLRTTDAGIQVVFVISGPVHYKSARTAAPPRISVDLERTEISPVLTKREFLSVHAALVRVTLTRAAGGTHATLDLAAAGSHSVYVVSDQLIVAIKRRPPVSARTSPVPLVGTPLPTFPVAAPEVAPQVSVQSVVQLDPRVRIPWTPLGPRIEAYVGASARHPDAAQITGFRQREPGDGGPVSEDTAAYLSYDNENLYVVFVCHDEPRDIRGHLVAREAIDADDQVSLYLDTFHDGRHAYVFASNPFGVQQDGVIGEGDDTDYSADMVWRSEGRITADGFVVVMAIPFKSVRFSADRVQSWRIAVGRTIARRGESAYWPYISRHVSGFVRQMAALEGIELVSPGRNVQLTPYGTFAQGQSFDRGTFANSRSEDRRAGFDAKVVVKNAVTVDATVNPDFSEVESDDPLIAVNQRYELFLPEKRPFFLENAALFATPINVFFSRRIADPGAGARVTARSSAWAAGGLLTNDRTTATEPATGLFGQGASIGVGTLQRQFGERSHAGVLVTERDDAGERNNVISTDTRIQFAPTWTVFGQAVRSQDRTLTGAPLTGTAYSAGISRLGPHFTYVADYSDIGSTLRVPLGFVPRLDIRAANQYAGYTWQFGDGGAWSLAPSMSALMDWDHAGQTQDRWATPDIGVARAGHFEIHVSRGSGFELFAGMPFPRNTTNVSISSGALRWLSVWGLYSRGSAINYTPAAGVAPFLGLKQGAYVTMTFRPLARLNVDQILLHERFDTLPGPTPATGQMVYATSMVRWKANLQLTKTLAIRGIVDYNQVDSTPSLFSQESSSGLMGDLLLRFLLHPGTAVYVGVNNRYENLVLDPYSETLSQHGGAPTFPVGQQFFVKLSYLFNF
jgi:hypothetical protein